MKSRLSLRSIVWLIILLVPLALAIIDKISTRRSHHMLLPNWATPEELRLQQGVVQQKHEPEDEETGVSSFSLRAKQPSVFTTTGIAHTTSTTSNTNKGVLQQFKEQANSNNDSNVYSNTVHSNNDLSLLPRFRMPAEHEPVAIVILAWDPFISEMLTRIAQLVVQAGAEVYLMISNYEYYAAPDLMDIVGLHPLHRIEYDSLWTRDYGPVIGILGKIQRVVRRMPTLLRRQQPLGKVVMMMIMVAMTLVAVSKLLIQPIDCTLHDHWMMKFPVDSQHWAC
jgi:hypothetical protein